MQWFYRSRPVISFQAIVKKFAQFRRSCKSDPGDRRVSWAIPARRGGNGGAVDFSVSCSIQLKPLAERSVECRRGDRKATPPSSYNVPGAQSSIQSGSRYSRRRAGKATPPYKFTLQADRTEPRALGLDAAHRRAALQKARELADSIRTSGRLSAWRSDIAVDQLDRDTALRLRLVVSLIDHTALRRVQTAASFHHLQRVRPISRGDGGRPADIGRDPATAARYLYQHAGRKSARHAITNAVAGTVTQRHRHCPHRGLRSAMFERGRKSGGRRGAQRANQWLANTGKPRTSAGRRQHETEDDVSARGRRSFRAWPPCRSQSITMGPLSRDNFI